MVLEMTDCVVVFILVIFGQFIYEYLSEIYLNAKIKRKINFELNKLDFQEFYRNLDKNTEC